MVIAISSMCTCKRGQNL